MPRLKRMLQFIDDMVHRVGLVFSFLLLPLMIITTIEVIARYIFNSPTIWAWDINMQIFSALVAIGGSYGLRHDMHVKVDVFVMNLRPRPRALLDLLTSVLFFFTMVVFLYESSKVAIESIKMREVMSTIWAPPVYHIMILIPIGALLFLLQGIAIHVRNLLIVIQKEKEVRQ
jgi:TRAP-type mannitol/chloroaromatic compound transport system permease small subunit